MHGQRVLTALILLPVVLTGLLWGGVYFFDSLVLIVSGLCLYEYFSMAFHKDLPLIVMGTLLGLVPIALVMLVKSEVMVILGLFIIFFISILTCIFLYKRLDDPLSTLLSLTFGASYIGLCTSLIALIRQMPYGNQWIFFLFIVVLSCDTGAYYVGKSLGRRKLCPAISKGKTVEGAFGGLAFSGFGAIASWAIFFDFFDLRLLLPLGLLLGVVGQFGDLTESIVKRAFGFKDSGTILPGHGGVFDRVDALLLAGPVLYWVLYFSHGDFFLR